jgi:hypothetical protein
MAARNESIAGMYSFDAELWLHEGEGGWHFITVPADVSDDIDSRTDGRRRGFGSVRVRATVRDTTWTTSVFPDTKRRAYVLPVKKEVRRQAGIEAGAVVPVRLEILTS